ncbi:MarR family transcriptional regulator [Hoeflea sp. G2-23]|uniref:MarR family transcriptional regulator n=1 Tax=Hoeflea algicola TaxID=2983763 RepID=A0ABT3Z3V5_9HYPH|nr:MarR family transcriptional regulator [Hoeflea algicola]MCY0146440.1 MarR family transcriptional regulator [Hoeflea algicola]
MAKGKLPAGFRPIPESMLCFDIYATHHAVGQVYHPLLSGLGLTYPQYLVMLVLWDGDGVTVGDLGQRLDLASSTLTPLVKRLESQGLVARTRDATDERKVRVHLTEAGQAMEARASHVPACVAEAFGLTTAEFSTLHAMLGKVRQTLQTDTEVA